MSYNLQCIGFLVLQVFGCCFFFYIFLYFAVLIPAPAKSQKYIGKTTAQTVLWKICNILRADITGRPTWFKCSVDCLSSLSKDLTILWNEDSRLFNIYLYKLVKTETGHFYSSLVNGSEQTLVAFPCIQTFPCHVT